MTERKGQLGQENWDSIFRDRTFKTGYSVQDIRGRIDRTGRSEHDSKERTAGTGQQGDDSWDVTEQTGQAWDRKAGTVHDGQNMTARTAHW
jgi:hypothetical protein